MSVGRTYFLGLSLVKIVPKKIVRELFAFLREVSTLGFVVQFSTSCLWPVFRRLRFQFSVP
jgi:hypothetical protein